MNFLDTNVLIYAFATGERADTARGLVADGGVVAVQSLNEFTDVSRRKLNKDWAEIDAEIGALLETCTLFDRVDTDVQADGRRIAERFKVRIFDAALLAIARAAGCDTFVSEDLQNGLVVDSSLTVANPFAY